MAFAHSDGVLLRRTVWSVAGWVLPALAALWAVPGLSGGLGAEGFGVLAIAWALVGWFGVADLGLSRGVTQGVALALHEGDVVRAAILTRGALRLMLPASLLAGSILWLLAYPLASHWLEISPGQQHESVRALQWLAGAIPATVVMTALRGVLEGGHAFALVTLLRIPLGVAFALLPLVAVRAGLGLPGAVQALVVVRLVAVVLHAWAAARVLPPLWDRRLSAERWSSAERRTLLSFGGWTTISNVVSPLLNTVDRLALGAMLPVAAVTPYAVAMEAGTKLWLLTAAVVPVLYPALTVAAIHEADAGGRLLLRSSRLLLAVGGLPLIAMAAVGSPLMTAWVGPSIGADAATVLRVLAVGLTANLVAQLALAYVQGAGRPDLPAFGHLAALPLYGVGLWVMVPRWGVVGAAVVWSLRAVADAWWLVWGCGHARVSAAPQIRRIQWLVSSATLGVAAIAASAQWISSGGAVVGGVLIWTAALALMVRDEAMLRSDR